MLNILLTYLLIITMTIGYQHFPGPIRVGSDSIDKINTQSFCEEKVTCTEVGMGWSTKPDTSIAIKDSIDMALKGKRYKNPTFAIIFGTASSNTQVIFNKARKVLGARTKIYGGISDYRKAMVDNKKADIKSSVVVITITSPNIKFGVGSVGTSRSTSLCDAVKTATKKAVENAGASGKRSPKLVLITPSAGHEAESVKGVKEILGNANIVVCGTPLCSKLDVFGEKNTYTNGVSSAVIYTNLPIGYSIIKRSFQSVKKPEEINQLFVWRCPHM